VDVRVIAATHRTLEELVKEGRFREDLYYRLAVVRLHIPPLRERPEDVALLARHFLDRFAARFGLATIHVPEALLDRLRAHRWPGNVRELENALESLVALSPAGELDLSLLPFGGESAPAKGAEPLGLRQRVEVFERGLVVEALREASGNRTEAARRLGISRVTLHDKLRKYGLGAGGDDDR
jgi:DNA-binding NtrC family response regulator